MATEATTENPAIPLAPAAPAPLSDDEKAKGEQAFNERIKKFKDKETELLLGILMVNWDKGNFIIDMRNDPRSFANHTVDDFSKAMNVSQSSVSTYVKFALKFNKEKVMEMAQLNIPWRAVVSLMTIQSEDKREALTLKLTHADPNKRITSDELQTKVKEINRTEKAKAKAKGARTSDRGGARPSVIVRSFLGLATDMIAKIPDFKQAYTDWKNLPEDADSTAKSEVAQLIKESYAAMKTLGDGLAKLHDFRERMSKK